MQRLLGRFVLVAVMLVLGGLGLVGRVEAQMAASAASSLVGQWQGSTEDAKPERVVLLVKASGGGALSGVVYLLDDDNASWPHATTTFAAQGGGVTFGIANIEVSFAGKVGADGALVGTWKQHTAIGVPLKLLRVTGDAMWEIPSQGKAMAAAADPSFEFATVKPADPMDGSTGFQLMGERLRVLNETMEAMISFAYGVHRAQILNAPGWFTTQRWVIEGTADVPGEPSLKQMRAMYRKLLEDRFALKLTQETREIPVYLMEVDKGEPKLTKSVSAEGLPDSTGNMNRGLNDMRYTNMTMDEFANDLSMTEDRPLVNRTGLAGRYDFRLRWSSADAVLTDRPDAPPVLFTAMKEQLGLKVDSAKVAVPVYVVAGVEKPSAN